jgi:hypothetical protein
MAWLVGDSSGRHRVTWPEPNTRALKAKARASARAMLRRCAASG